MSHTVIIATGQTVDQIRDSRPCDECGEHGHDARDHQPLALVDYSPELLAVLTAAHDSGAHDARR
jgi:hypothetical protein